MTKQVIKIKATKTGEKEKRNVAAYCRVSTDERSQLNSLSNQVSYYNELITKTPGYNYVGVFSDEGISGTSIKRREGFKELLSLCDKGKVDLILVKSISRFARNAVDLLSITRELKEKGVEVQFEKERISTFSGDGEIMLSVLSSFAQNESESISSNIKWRLKKNYEQGKLRYQKTYGFDIKNGAYIINEKEAKVVKFIFSMFLGGKAYAEISEILNELGIKSSHGNKWSRTIVKKTINQEKYAGYAILQKEYIENPLTHKQVKNHGEKDSYRVDDATPAIIKIKDFEKAQELMQTTNERVDRWRVRRTWITGLVKCPLCHGNMTPQTKRGVLRCMSHNKGHGCTNNQVYPIIDLKNAIKQKFHKNSFNEDLIKSVKRVNIVNNKFKVEV